MRLLKRLAAVLVAVSLFCAVLPLPASALTSGDFDYELLDDGSAVSITAYNGTDSAVVIPSQIDGLPVTKIDQGAFRAKSTLVSITFPDTLRSIGTRAFEACTKLTSVSFPDSLMSIGSQAFYNCVSLKEIDISPYTYSMGPQAFHNTAWMTGAPDGALYLGRVLYTYCGAMENNTVITVDDFTAAIAPNAFEGRDELKAVYLPVGLRLIGAYAFADCSSLMDIRIPPSVTSIHSGILSGSPAAIMLGVYGSAADIYAQNNDLYFENDPTLNYLDGDMNKDGAVTSTDLRLLMRTLVNGSECDHERYLSCDIVYDGVIDTKDLRKWLMSTIL